MKTKNVTKFCTEPSCMQKMIFLLNTATNKMVPVDYSTLTADELYLVDGRSDKKTAYAADVVLCYNSNHHVSHFKTCKKPNLFTNKGKE